MTQQYSKPIPVPQQDNDFYWEKAKEHEFWLRKCNDCQDIYFYPRDICPNCFSRNVTWVQSSGKGTLYAFAIVHRAPLPAFGDDVPFVIAMVQMEGSARVPSNLVGVEPDPEKIKIGMPVEVTFEDITDTISLPKFKPA
jgi:hypothetical protein